MNKGTVKGMPAKVILLVVCGCLLAVGAVALVIRLFGEKQTPATVAVPEPTVTAAPTPTPQPTALPTPTPTPQPADMPVGYDRGGLELPYATPNADIARNLSGSGVDFHSKEKHMDMPDVWEGIAVYSAGSGGLVMPVLTRLYLQDLAEGKETLLAETKLYNGSYYETLLNEHWIVYIETDHGLQNFIYVMERATGKVSQIKECTSGRPRLRLWENTLVWMEPAEEGDKLYMIDLESQENIALAEFPADSPYALSAPWVQNGYVTWADSNAEGEDVICWMPLEEAAAAGEIVVHTYAPGVYVHEPMFDGSNYVWLDTNKSYLNRLCYADTAGNARVIAENVTTYSMGDGFVTYGTNQSVWVYIFATGEACRLTAEGEVGIMPRARGMHVVWDTTRTDGNRDVFRCLTLDAEKLDPTHIVHTPLPVATAAPAKTETPVETPLPTEPPLPAED